MILMTLLTLTVLCPGGVIHAAKIADELKLAEEAGKLDKVVGDASNEGHVRQYLLECSRGPVGGLASDTAYFFFKAKRGDRELLRALAGGANDQVAVGAVLGAADSKDDELLGAVAELAEKKALSTKLRLEAAVVTARLRPELVKDFLIGLAQAKDLVHLSNSSKLESALPYLRVPEELEAAAAQKGLSYWNRSLLRGSAFQTRIEMAKNDSKGMAEVLVKGTYSDMRGIRERAFSIINARLNSPESPADKAAMCSAMATIASDKKNDFSSAAKVLARHCETR